MRTIELTPNQNSVFEVDVDGKRYSFEFKFNSRNGIWTTQLSLGGVVLLSGVPAVIGVELYQGNALPDVPKNLYMIPVNGNGEDSDFSNLGLTSKFIIVEQGDNVSVAPV